MTYQHLSIERRGPIAVVTFNRPERANALNYAHLAEIEQAALAFRDDAQTRVVIFTGAGKHFSSGADLTDPGVEYRVPLVLRRRRTRIGERVIHALYDIDQITIAAWNGAAMGGGACIATALDFRVGADDCFMQYPEIDIGLNLMWQSLPLCTRLVGAARAKRLVAGGERVHAPTLLQWGALDELVPRAELLNARIDDGGALRGKTTDRGADDQTQRQRDRSRARPFADAHGRRSESARADDRRPTHRRRELSQRRRKPEFTGD